MHSSYGTPPKIGFVNWVGIATLIEKEIRRFLAVWGQTIFAPLFTAFVFLQIFVIAIGHLRPNFGDISFDVFIVPGVVMMTVIQNAFANSSSSLMSAKMQKTIFDLQVAPLSEWEILFAMVFAATLRASFIALLLLAMFATFIELPFHHVPYMMAMLMLGSVMMACLGILAAVIAEKFDHMALLTNFVITPLSFLSGTFYSIDRLPETLQTISAFNPFFYLIDGFRFGMTAYSDASPRTAILVSLGLAVVLYVGTWGILRSGYHLKT
ncbi:MAG: ABC transporter permease [Alphaproteobacteria bacterium]|nr:ABC transporter permease [Alphaproteobacteria bacterium]